MIIRIKLINIALKLIRHCIYWAVNGLFALKRSWGQLYCILIRQQKHAPTLQYGYKRRCKRSEGDHCVDNTLWLLCQATVRKLVQIRKFTIFGYKRVSGISKE